MNNINISPQKQKLIVYIILTIATLAVFWQINGYEFINFDDNGYIIENRHIQSGITLDGLRWAFGTRYLDLWNPLIWLSFMFDYQLHGMNAGGYHLTNLILHILSTLLLFWLFNRMTGMIWRSAFVAAVFALHPLHVESVAWIAERKDVLSAFFWMLTLCLYVYYTEKPAIKRYLLVLFSFVCALMSKPMVVTLPVIMILLDYWPLGRFELQKGKTTLILWQLKEKIPFFVLSAVLIFITLYTPNDPGTSVKSIPLGSRLANAPVSFVTYLAKTFWPQDMTIFYPFPDQIPLGQVVGASLLIIVISALVIAMIKRLPYLFVGWLWFAITIAPVIGILQISLTVPYAMADRYHYLPSIGLAVILAWGIPSLLKIENARKRILLPAGIASLAILSVLTWEQCHYWKNSMILFNHALRVTNNNYMAHTNFAVALAEKGRLNEAINHYNKAIIIAPDRALPYYNRGTSYGRTGQYQLAVEDFNNAIHLDRNYIKAYNNRGIAYTKLGLYQMALIDFNKAISLQEDYADAYNNRAFVYLNQGDNISGCSDAKKACELGNCKALEFAKSRNLCR